MVDTLDSHARSRNMAKIKSKNTKPEMIVRKYLHSKGLRYRLHDKQLIGKPDLAFPRFRTVIFVHGCFWHRHEGCKFAYTPKTRSEFWQAKFEANMKRDELVIEMLIQRGWKVIIVWECALKSKDNSSYLKQVYMSLFSDQKLITIEP